MNRSETEPHILYFESNLGRKRSQLIECDIVGLGSGALAMFFHEFFTKFKINVIELDQTVLDIACQFFQFNFQQSPRLTVSIEDGLAYYENESKKGLIFFVLLEFSQRSFLRCISQRNPN